MSDVSLNLSDNLSSLSSSSTTTTETTSSTDPLKLDDIEFLEMLTTQLKYQDPLNPADNQQFADQMATLTTMQTNNKQLDMLTEIKKGLEAMSLSLYSSSAAMTNSATVNLIGKEAKIATDSLFVDEDLETGDTVDVNVEIFENNANAEMVITDKFGEEVYRAKVSSLLDDTSVGEHSYSWRRVNNEGEEVPAGEYNVSFEVSGESYSKMTLVRQSVVSGVKFEGDTAYVKMDGENYPVGMVLEIF